VPTIEDVPEAEAEGRVKAIFDDVRATLGVPSVGLVFRQLAVYPWFLQLAWRNLKPNVGIAYYQRASADLRDHSLHLAGSSRTRLLEDGAKSAQLDMYARMLLATAALRAGLHGQVPKLRWISAEDKRVLDPPAPDPSVTQEQLNAVLAAAAQSLRDHRDLEAYALELRERAAILAEALPYRMEISATACRQAGLTEPQIDAVKQVLDGTWASLPRAMLALCPHGDDHRPAETPQQAAAPA
jgi:hypothetical protein